MARRVARPDRGAQVLRLAGRSRALEGRRGSRSCASAAKDAHGDGNGAARAFGARIVPAAAPSRAASPHGAGGTCASASAPKTRFGNEGDNAIGRLGGGASSEGSSARGAGRGVRSSAAASTPSTTPDNPWRAPQGAMGTAGPSARRRLTVSSLLRHERARRWRASGRTRFREKRKFFFFDFLSKRRFNNRGNSGFATPLSRLGRFVSDWRRGFRAISSE